MKTISVVIPSRLAKMPPHMGGFYWLDRAIASIRMQTYYEICDWQIIIGVDQGQKIPSHFLEGDARSTVTFAQNDSIGQAGAVNAAAKMANGEFLAVLEDDDFWHPQKIQAQIMFMGSTDLVTTNQRVIDFNGAVLGISEFPTPSTWLMRVVTWGKVGGFDPKFRWHVDTEWLGRFNQLKLRREHIVHVNVNRNDLRSLIDVSSVITLGHNQPLVDRTDNLQGGLHKIVKDEEAKLQSKREYDIMLERFGKAPW